jgi:hypothetical protein
MPFRHIILIYHSLHFLLKSKCVAGIEVAIHIGLEPMIYHTRAEHPNHYTTSTVCLILKEIVYVNCIGNELMNLDGFVL